MFQTESEVELKVAFYQSELRNFVPPQTWRHMESDKSILGKLYFDTLYTVELQWLEHIWNHENMFETGVV